jgi:hypothetical protein
MGEKLSSLVPNVQPPCTAEDLASLQISMLQSAQRVVFFATRRASPLHRPTVLPIANCLRPHLFIAELARIVQEEELR